MKTDDPRSADLSRRAFCLGTAALTVSAVAPGLSAASRGNLYLDDVTFALDEIEKKCAHFFELKGIDWKDVRRRFTLEARKVRNAQQHLQLLVRLLARLEDGHASVRVLKKGPTYKWPGEEMRRWTGPGMFWCRIGEKIHIKNVFGPARARGFLPGMEILQVDGLPVQKWIERRTQVLADVISFSTDQQAFFYTCHWGLGELPGKRRRLVIRDAKGKKKSRTLAYTKASLVPEGPAYLPADLEKVGDIQFGKLPGGQGYIHFRRCPGNLPELTDGALEALADVTGMVLDFRGNSGGGFDHDGLLGRFVPSGRQMRFTKRIPSAGSRPYGGPVVVIVDATVRSAGETGSGMFKEDGRAYMIGESNTAGMSSSKTTIELPSGLFGLYVSVFSNKKRFNRGEGIEGIGIRPHEIVEFRPEDLAAEKDTLIERAVAILGEFPADQVPYKPADFGWKPGS